MLCNERINRCFAILTFNDARYRKTCKLIEKSWKRKNDLFKEFEWWIILSCKKSKLNRFYVYSKISWLHDCAWTSTRKK